MHWKCRRFNKEMFYQTYCASLANKRHNKILKFSEELTNHVDFIVFPKRFDDLCLLSQQRCSKVNSAGERAPSDSSQVLSPTVKQCCTIDSPPSSIQPTLLCI